MRGVELSALLCAAFAADVVADNLGRFSNPAPPQLRPAPLAPAVAGKWIDASQFDSERQFVAAMRRQPWNRPAIEAFAAWLDSRDAERARFVRAMLQFHNPADQNEYEDAIKRLTELSPKLENAAAAAVGPCRRVLVDAAGVSQIVLDTASDDAIRRIAERAPSVRDLCILDHSLTLEGFKALVQLPYLDSVEIEGGDVTDAAMRALEELPPYVRLRISVGCVPAAKLTASSARRIARFERLSAEEKYEAGVRYIGSSLDGIRFGAPVVAVGFNDNGDLDEELRLLSGIPNLQSLFVQGERFTSRGLSWLGAHPELHVLHLVDVPLDTLEPLRNVGGLEVLTFVPSAKVRVTDADLAALETLTNLKELTIYARPRSQIGDATVLRIAKLPILKKLELQHVRLKDRRCLSALDNLKKLEELTVGFEPTKAELNALQQRLKEQAKEQPAK